MIYNLDMTTELIIFFEAESIFCDINDFALS